MTVSVYSGLAADAGLAIEPLDAAAWADLSARFLDHNYRQSWAFARACAERVGARSEHVAIRRGDEVVAVCDVRVRRLPLFPGGIAYVNGGPLVRRDLPGDGERLEQALCALRAEYAQRRSLTLRIAPPAGPPRWNEEVSCIFARAGFELAGEAGSRTFLVDLRPPPEEIRAAFAQKWRNGLNSAERQGLTLDAGDDPGRLERFAELFARFRERKAFDLDLDAAFYARVARAQDSQERFHVAFAMQNGSPVAGFVGSFLGDTAVYLLGATLEAGLKAKAGYLLQWHAVLEARERGLAWYDLGGIDPESNPGVYRFKRGLGGMDVSAPGPFELAAAGPGAMLTRLGERAYRAMKGRRGGGDA